MRVLKVVFVSIIATGIIGAFYSFKAFTSVTKVNKFPITQEVNTNLSPKAQQLLDQQVISQLKAMHDPANIKMFSRAYIGSIWKSELLSKPKGKQKYYDMELREYRGAFIVDQYKMRIFETEGKVMLEDWTNGNFLTADKWLDFYKNQKGKQ